MPSNAAAVSEEEERAYEGGSEGGREGAREAGKGRGKDGDGGT